MAVLAVLAVCGERGCSRERLLALLWPESDESHARHGLRDALHTLRHTLTPACIPSSASLLRLDPAVVASDVVEFTQAMASGRLADAARAYRGPLLDGFHLDGAPEFEHWLAGERTRLARECVEALEALATSAESTGTWVEAVGWWGRAVEHDPINSHFVLHQVRAMSVIGDRANAVQAGEQHVRHLREEFGLEPDPAVLAMIGRIRRGDLPVPHDGAARLLGMAGLAAVAVVVAGVRTSRGPRTGGADAGPPRTAIAVLPFRNLTTDTAQAWFAAGLHDELLSQLANVAELRVIGSASVSGYGQTDRPLDQIGQELAVGSIVRGSVQVAGGRLRVIVHLLDPATGADLWAETYDRPLNDAFTVQSDIAQRVVSAVGVALSRAEAGGLTEPPTANSDAYLLYLQGLEYAGRPGDQREDLAIAQRQYERAIRLDSSFALAHAALSTIHWRIFSRRLDTSPARAELQLREARAALRLAPDLPEAHVAMALTYCCGRYSDRQEAEALMAASRYAPNDASLWNAISVVQARLGNWDSVEAAFERARRLDPRNADLLQAQGNRLHCLGRYPEAIETYRRAMLLAPDYVQPHIALGWSYILWQGQTDTLRAALAAQPDIEPGGGAPRVGLEHAILMTLDRQPDSLLALLRSLEGETWTSGESFFSRQALAATAHLLRGDTVAARAANESVAVQIDSALRARPNDASLHMMRGGVMAELGRRAEALREVRWLEQSDGYRNNHNCPPEPEARALILAQLGERDSALAAIERLLAGPSRVTAHTIRLDPVWDPARRDPRIEALLLKYRNPGP
ncbi:MAG: transcriptional activator protein [Gemmatimonadetes bacterium]|nr:transcriptional activator protein [Gemmatimonadota bacterium]